MGYPLKTETYNYETLLWLIGNYPDGITSAELKKGGEVHKGYDLNTAIMNKGYKKLKAKGEETHFSIEALNPTTNRLTITDAGIVHLDTFDDLIQKDLSKIKLLWRDGFNEDGTRDENYEPRTYKKRAKETPQAQIPLEEPEYVLSSVAQHAFDVLTEVAAVSTVTKTCIEEAHCTISKFFEENPTYEFTDLSDGMVKPIVDETIKFRKVLEVLLEQTTEVLTEAAQPVQQTN